MPQINDIPNIFYQVFQIMLLFVTFLVKWFARIGNDFIQLPFKFDINIESTYKKSSTISIDDWVSSRKSTRLQ